MSYILTKREKILIFILLVIVVPPLLVFFPIYIFFKEKQFKRDWNKFLEDYNNKNILVCTREHDWENFLKNDLLPILTPDTVALWSEDFAQRKTYQVVRHYIMSKQQSFSRPFFMVIREKQVVRSDSINELFLSLKMPGKRSPETQQAVRVVIQQQWPEIQLN